MIELTDEELLSRLRRSEDDFVERKTSGDYKDSLKTVVAFANSAPEGFPGVLYLGVRNDGTVEENTNLDSLQRKFTELMKNAYPPIYYLQKVLEIDGKQFLVVIVPGSSERPHFAGPSYVRRGSQTIKASEKQFDELIAKRQGKPYEILKWKDKPVTHKLLRLDGARVERKDEGECIIADCNQFYVTIRSGSSGQLDSYPLSRVDLSFDHHNDRLLLELGYYY